MHCTAGGKSRTYFVPDTGAQIVGPRVRSPSKIAGVTGALTAVLLSAGLLLNWRVGVARDEREASAKHEAEIRAENAKEVAAEQARTREVERKAAEARAQQEIEQAIAKAKTTTQDLIAAKTKGAPDRLALFQTLNDSIVATKNAPETKQLAELCGPASQLVQRLAELDRLDAIAPDLPPIPDKPTFEKPTYHGAFYLDGEVRGNYEGDPVVQAGSSFFIIHGVTLWLDGHYIETTTETVTLNIGRDGREATVANLSSRETYNDDQQRYAAEVETAQDIYRKELADFNAAAKLRQDAEANARQAKQARAAERSKIKGARLTRRS